MIDLQSLKTDFFGGLSSQWKTGESYSCISSELYSGVSGFIGSESNFSSSHLLVECIIVYSLDILMGLASSSKNLNLSPLFAYSISKYTLI